MNLGLHRFEKLLPASTSPDDPRRDIRIGAAMRGAERTRWPDTASTPAPVSPTAACAIGNRRAAMCA